MTETNPTPNPAAPAPAGRGIRIALAVSVALNLGVLAMGVGMMWHGGPGGHGDMVRDLNFGPFTEALSPDDRHALRQSFMTHLPDFRAERQRMRSDAEAVLAALRTQPFDPAALRAAMGTMQDHMRERMDLGSQMIEDMLAAMTPEARAAFADRLEASLRRGPGRSGD